MNVYYTDDNYAEEKRKQKLRAKHYYGDTVRSLFVLGAIIMAVMLPVFNDQIPLPTIVSIAVIVFIGLMAGLTDPTRHWVAWVNVLICIGVVIVLEYTAIQAFAHIGQQFWFFWVNQILVVDFFVALYFGMKTLRGML